MFKWSHPSALWLCCAALAAVADLTCAQAQGPYKIQQRYVLGGEGYWDYLSVDVPSRRLYIAHQTQVDAMDLDSGKLLGSVKNLTRAHGTVILGGGKTGFVSDGGGNRVVAFDPSSFAITASIPTGKNPDGLLFEPTTNTLWAFNGASKDAAVIDVASQKVVATIPMPGKPEFPATDGEGTIFVNIDGANVVARIDAKTQKITATWKLKGCDGPSGLALDRQGERLFSVCDGRVMPITSAKDGSNLGVAKVGDPDAVVYDPKAGLAFTPNEEGTLSVVDTTKPGYPTIQTLPTMPGARTLAQDPVSGKLYTVSAKQGAMPKPTPGIAHTRRTPLPGTFVVLVIGR